MSSPPHSELPLLCSCHALETSQKTPRGRSWLWSWWRSIVMTKNMNKKYAPPIWESTLKQSKAQVLQSDRPDDGETRRCCEDPDIYIVINCLGLMYSNLKDLIRQGSERHRVGMVDGAADWKVGADFFKDRHLVMMVMMVMVMTVVMLMMMKVRNTLVTIIINDKKI